MLGIVGRLGLVRTVRMEDHRSDTELTDPSNRLSDLLCPDPAPFLFFCAAAKIQMNISIFRFDVRSPLLDSGFVAFKG